MKVQKGICMDLEILQRLQGYCAAKQLKLNRVVESAITDYLDKAELPCGRGLISNKD